MAHPVLDSAHVEPGAEHPRGVRGAEFAKVKPLGIEFGALCNLFALV